MNWTLAGSWVVAALALLGATGCGGAAEGVNGATTNPSGVSAVAQIRRTWIAFFSGATPQAEKTTLLQNGQRLARVIASEASLPLARQTKATITSVRLVNPLRATVRYSITLAGKPVLKDQVGNAVFVNGSWQVGEHTFCALLTLEGTRPAGCT